MNQRVRKVVLVTPLHLVTLAVIILVVAVMASPRAGLAQGGTCIDDVTGRTNNCTANDVRISDLRNSEDISCEAGSDVELNLRARLVATANERYDIGTFVALDGGEARTGTCQQDYLPPPLSAGGTCSVSAEACHWDGDCPSGEQCTGGYDPLSGAGPFFNAEAQEDADDLCGDIEQAVETFYDLVTVTVPCQDMNGDGYLDIGTCVSWDNNKNSTCVDVDGAIPGTAAKCNCELTTVGNVIVHGSLQVTKVPVPDTLVEPGGNVEFTFVVTNPSQATVTLDTLEDSVYGDLAAYAETTCELPQTLAPAASYTCTILAPVVGAPGAHTDTVTASGLDQNEDPVSASAMAQVTITGLLPTIVLTKTVEPVSLMEPGGEVTYTVEIENTSGTPDPVTLTSLTDSLYGDLTDPSNPLISDGTCELVTIDPDVVTVVDGAPDSVPTTPAAAWRQVSGARGSVVQVASIDPGGGTVTNYYKDDQTLDPEDTGDQASFGDAGIGLASPTGVVRFSFASYVLGANQGNVGGTYQQYIANPIATAATAQDYLLAAPPPGVASAAWTRTLDPAIMTGSQLPLFSGVALHDLFVYAFQGGAWVEVPFQFDEVNSGGAYVALEDAMLDSNDELVFMAADIGETAETSQWLEDADSRNYPRYEVEVTNPLNPAEKGWVYVYRSMTLTSTFAPYVKWDGFSRVLAGSYIAGYAPMVHWGMDSLELNGSGVDVLDRAKFRLSGACNVAGTWYAYSLNEDSPELRGQWAPPTIQGPVRLGGGTLTTQTWSYAAMYVAGGEFDAGDVPFPCTEMRYDLLRLSNDWLNPSESGMAPMAYYDSNTSSGGVYTCTFKAQVSGTGGSVITDTVTAVGADDEGNPAEASDDAAVAITGSLLLEVIKEVEPECVAKAGDVAEYTVVVSNPNDIPLDLTALDDDLYDDLTDPDNPKISDSTCELATIEASETYSCTFKAAVVFGPGSTSLTDTVTAQATDRAGKTATDTDTATVTLCVVPPDTGVGMPASALAGGLAGLGLALAGAGAWLRRRSR